MSGNGPQGDNGPQNGWFFSDAGHSTDAESHGLFTVYGSYGAFLSGENASINLVPLGNNGMSDDDIRSQNMAAIFNAMGNYVAFFWEDSNQYPNVFPINNIQANFERVSSNSAKASLYSLDDSKFYDFSQSPSSSSGGVWKQRVQYNTSGDISLDDGTSISGSSSSIEFDGSSVITSSGENQMTYNGGSIDLNNQTSILNLKISDQSSAAATVGQLSQQTSGGIQDAFGNVLNPTSRKVFGLQDISVTTGYNYPDNKVFCINSFNYSEYTSINETLDYYGPDNQQNGWFSMYVIPSDLGTGECLLVIHESVIDDYATLAGFEKSNIMALHIDGIHAIIPDDINHVYEYPSNCYMNYQGSGVSTSSTANNYTDPMYVDENGDLTYQDWDGANTQRCSSTVFSIENAFDVKLQKSNIYAKTTNDNCFSVYDTDSNWYSVKIMFKNHSFSDSSIRPFFTSIANPDQPSTGPSVIQEDLGSSFFSSANTSVTGVQIERNTDGLKEISDHSYGIQNALENNLGSLGSLTSRNEFRIGMGYDSVNDIGTIAHSFDVDGEVKHKGVSLGSPAQVSFQMDDDQTVSVNTSQSNQLGFVDLQMHIKTPSEDSWVNAYIHKQGSTFEAKIGKVIGKDFTQIDVEYDAAKSGEFGKHYFNVVGNGAGALMDIHVLSNKTFNK